MLLERCRVLWARLRALVLRRKLERDLDEELAFHLEMRAHKYGGGAEARLAARREFGNTAHIRETCREVWTFAALEAFRQDLRYAVRTLAKTPAFTAVAVVSLALGIGANAAIFSLLDAMLLRDLPVKNPGDLVEFIRASADSKMTNLPYPVFAQLSRDRAVLADLFAIHWNSSTLRAGDLTEPVTAHEVSGSFFPSLGVAPLVGRAIGPDDDRPGAARRVAVLSHAFWSRRFGADAAALGATLRIAGEPFTVIGIMPPEFFGFDRGRVPDLWTPLAADPHPDQVWVLGRPRPGVSAARAQSQLQPLFHQALPDDRDFQSQRLLVNPAPTGPSGLRWSYWDRNGTLKILLGLSALVLLIACANLANLLMARSAARSREIGIRMALGAGRWRLVRQLLTENLLLSFAGGALGMVMCGLGHRLLLGFLVRNPQQVALDFRLDYRLLGVGLALSIGTGLLFGLLPAMRATRAPSHQRGAWNMPLAKGLLAAQIGMSMVLLIGAGLFARSLRNLGAADLGLARDNLLLMDVAPSAKAPEARERFWNELTRRVSALPGVRSLALAGDAVFGNGGWNQDAWIARAGQAPRHAPAADNWVGPGFFATAGIPILVGREFGEQDRRGAPQVALVNRTFARRYFGTENPIGLRFGDTPAAAARFEIVGVVADAKYGSVRERQRAMLFYPLGQKRPLDSCVLHVRAASDGAAMAAALRHEIQAIDSDALAGPARSLPRIVHDQLRQDRMFATLAGFFALLALALGAIGIYGIVAYRVARRTAEIGIRMALGARRGDVLLSMLRETLALVAAGAAVGLPASWFAAKPLGSLLFGLRPWDPATFVGATAVLFAAGALAGFLPARRAASIEPSAALRGE